MNDLLRAPICSRQRLRPVAASALVAITVGLIGCDAHPARVPVSGTVTIDGTPLKRGNIKFVPEVGRPSVGKIDEDGRFTLTCYDGKDGALLGKHRVQIASNRIISDSKIEWFAPPNYADFRSSGLEVNITKAESDLKLELSWGDRKGPYVAGR